MVVISQGYVYAIKPAARQNVNEKVLPERQSVYDYPPDLARPERNAYTDTAAAAQLMFTELQRRRFKSYTKNYGSKVYPITGGKFNGRY